MKGRFYCRGDGAHFKIYLEAKYPGHFPCGMGRKHLLTNKHEYDFCIVDVMMPVKDGFSLAKDIRNIDKKVPILFLTAKSMQEDKLKGFELGADDYLTKPFNMEELLARMEAILRRSVNDEKKTRRGYLYSGKMELTMRQTPSVVKEEANRPLKSAALLKCYASI